MFDYSKNVYGERIKFFLEHFENDKLLKYIQTRGWAEEFFSDEKFFTLIKLETKYTNNQAASLLGLTRGQRIINLLNNKREANLNDAYLKPQKIGDRYTHDAIILFKFKMIFFLYGKGLNTLEIENILELTPATAVMSNPNSLARGQQALNRTVIREVVLEQMLPMYEVLNDFAEKYDLTLGQLQETYNEKLEYTEELNRLLNHLNTANNDISVLEKRIADLKNNATSLTTNLVNFEQIKRINLKTELIAKVENQLQPQPVKQGFFQRLFAKPEEPTVSNPELERELRDIENRSIRSLLNDEEKDQYNQLLNSIKKNTEELNQAIEYLGRARERKNHIESQIEKLENKKASLESISFENPLKMHLEKMKLFDFVEEKEIASTQGDHPVERINEDTIEVIEVIENNDEK